MNIFHDPVAISYLWEYMHDIQLVLSHTTQKLITLPKNNLLNL